MLLPTQLEHLRQCRAWINYALVWSSRKHGVGGYDKPPINPHTLRNANISDPEHLATFDECNNLIGMPTIIVDGKGNNMHVAVTGVGLVLQAVGLVGIDLDNVVRTTPSGCLAYSSEAISIMRQLHSYTEISVSGTGIHILVIGTKPGTKCRVSNSDGSEYEMYDNGRYFTLSGKVIPNGPDLCKNDKGIQYVYGLISAGKDVVPNCARQEIKGLPRVSEPDFELWDKMFRSKKGEIIKRLFEGDISDYAGDASRADYALLNYIGYWCNYDRERMDRMFRQSGLMRDKWKRPDYRSRTIYKVINGGG